jgi:hypothetical protein
VQDIVEGKLGQSDKSVWRQIFNLPPVRLPWGR